MMSLVLILPVLFGFQILKPSKIRFEKKCRPVGSTHEITIAKDALFFVPACLTPKPKIYSSEHVFFTFVIFILFFPFRSVRK